MIHSRIVSKEIYGILKYFFCFVLRTRNFWGIDLEAKKIAEICKISRVCVNAIVREIRILIAKECEKISKTKFLQKMSGEIEEGESYFLLCYTRNCKQKEQKECVVSVGVGLARKRLCFYFVLRIRNSARMYAKTLVQRLYAKTLALQKNYCRL